MWSKCLWVTKMWLSVQPRSFSAAMIGSASGASIAAVLPLFGSCRSTAKLSDRVMNWATSSFGMRTPDSGTVVMPGLDPGIHSVAVS